MTDNLLCYWGLTRGKASGVQFSRTLGEIYSMLEGVNWTIHWVPSADQKADFLSRQF